MTKTNKIKRKSKGPTIVDYEKAAKNLFEGLYLNAQDLDPGLFCVGLSRLTYLMGRLRKYRPLEHDKPIKKLPLSFNL